jgi:hypothetical protein
MRLLTRRMRGLLLTLPLESSPQEMVAAHGELVAANARVVTGFAHVEAGLAANRSRYIRVMNRGGWMCELNNGQRYLKRVRKGAAHTPGAAIPAPGLHRLNGACGFPVFTFVASLEQCWRWEVDEGSVTRARRHGSR